MTDYQIKQIALRLYQEETKKKLELEKEQAKRNEKQDIQDRISYELEQLRRAPHSQPKDDISILKEQEMKLFGESKRLAKVRKTQETVLSGVRNKLAVIYNTRDRARDYFARMEKDNDLEIVYKYKGPGYHTPLRELAEEAMKMGIVPDSLLNEKKEIAFLELQEKEKEASIIWSEEKTLEKTISELTNKINNIEYEAKNLREERRQTEQNLRNVLNKTKIYKIIHNSSFKYLLL
jgi:hypothetical protein